MKQTAVQWLVEKLMKGDFANNPDELIERAKAMEKEQIIDAYLNDRPKAGIDKALKLWDQAEQYYKETYD